MLFKHRKKDVETHTNNNNPDDILVYVTFNPEKAYRWIVNTDSYKISTALQEAELRAYLRFMKDLKPTNLLIYALAFVMIIIAGIIAVIVLNNMLPITDQVPTTTPTTTPLPVQIE